MIVKPPITVATESIDPGSLGLAVNDQAPCPMALVEGANYVVRYVNPAFCRLMDASREELIGRPFGEKIAEKKECLRALDSVYRTGKSESYTEEEYATPEPFFWSYTMWPVAADERPAGVMIQVTETAKFHEQTVELNQALMLGAVHQHELAEAAEALNIKLQEEISVRSRTEEALRQAQALLKDRAGQLEGLVAERTKELSATNQQMEAFAYSIAHDLRAPLRAVQGYAAMLVEEGGPVLNEATRSYADHIIKSALFMDALLIDLLAFSRISQQRMELKPVSLQVIAESVLSRLAQDIQATNAHIDSPETWPVVLAHEQTLSQVLFNLMSNALKFVAPGSPSQIQLRWEENAGVIRVWVEDSGIGIAADHQNQIFRLFTRLEGEKYPGTGIGLAIVQKGVERMRGRVGVESDFGRGSRFWFELKKG